MTGLEVAAGVRAGSVSAREVVAGALATAEALQPVLNACTLIDQEGALGQAEAIDRMVAAGSDPGPLAGVPIALKDLIDHAGRATTCGSAFYRQVAVDTAPAVRRLEEAGAVVVCRTNLHEFAFGFSSENPWFGPVRNPWDASTSPGGSSGGSAVAVAAGLAPVAVGTDTGGSVRVPAALCGVIGLKVTFGRIPTQGVFPLCSTLDTVGPIARTVGDLAVAYQVMAGLPVAPPSRLQPAGVRIGVPVDWIEQAPLAPEAGAAHTRALGLLESAGAIIEELSDSTLVPFGLSLDVVGAEVTSVHGQWLAEGRRYGEDVEGRLRQGLEVDLDRYLAAQRWRVELRAAFVEAFRRFDLLLTPAVGAYRKLIGEDLIDGNHYRRVLSWFSLLVNHAECPAISLPLRLEGSPPPSLQLIAPWWREDLLLGVAASLEEEGLVGSGLAPRGRDN